MSLRLVLLVLFSVAICNGVPAAELPEVETTNANEKPITAEAGPAWVPLVPIVETATETPVAVSPAAPVTTPPVVVTEPPVKAIVEGDQVNKLQPIVGETQTFERPKPIAADGPASGENKSVAVGDEEVSEPVMVTGNDSDPVMPTGGCTLPVLHLGTIAGALCVFLTLN